MKRIIEIGFEADKKLDEIESMIIENKATFDPVGGLNEGTYDDDDKPFTWFDLGNEDIGSLLHLDWDKVRRWKDEISKLRRNFMLINSYENLTDMYYFLDHIQTTAVEDFKIPEERVYGVKEKT